MQKNIDRKRELSPLTRTDARGADRNTNPRNRSPVRGPRPTAAPHHAPLSTHQRRTDRCTMCYPAPSSVASSTDVSTSILRHAAFVSGECASRSYCASRAQAALQAAQEPSNVRHKVVAADAIGELRPEARVRAVVHARHVAKTRHRRQQAIDAPFLLRRDDLDKRRSSAVTESSFYARFCPRGLGIP